MTRREFLETGAAALAPAQKRPNIVVIMADDLGISDIGCYGSEIATPNLDGLAGRGIRFTQFYNTARCCPTRAALLTGLYQHQAGIGLMVQDQGVPSYQGYLNDRCVTIAEALKQAGYTTLMSGKWHVGENRPHWPTDRGFDKYFGLISGASNYFRLDPGRKMAMDDEPYTPGKNFYMTDAITEHAVGFLRENARAPFFLYVAYTSPHWPLHALPEDIEKYRGRYMKGWDVLRRERHARMIELGIVERRWRLSPRHAEAPAWDDIKDKEAMDLRMAVYAAQIDRMDQGIGRILRQLRDMGAERDTLVMFLADNGGCAERVDRGTPGVPPGGADSFLSYGLPWANASNTPFRWFKQWVHEGGIASPLIAYWPGRTRNGGAITHEPGHVIDMMATCLDAAGAEYPRTHRGREITPLEGRSLVPAIYSGSRRGHDALYWEHVGHRAVRKGNMKLVSRYRSPWELYDLEADRTELNDLAASQPDRVRELAGMWDAWARKAGAMLPDQLPRRRKKEG